jgi:CRISPR system Cascade subunit CasA
MNLIHDAWIPIRRKHGEETRIAPWEVTTRYGDDPIVTLAAPRPDFNGTLIQFLIGTLQTTCAPDSPRAWRTWLREPPSPEELHAKLHPVAYAFELDSDGTRFMQDAELKSAVVKEATPIGALLIDSPGENTMQRNTDHFIKRGGVEKLCSTCTATALFTLQTNAPSGGQGHRTGLRGGGPLTTLIMGDTLWQTVWLNVLENTAFLADSGDPGKAEPSHHFPWLASTRTSEKGSRTEMTTPLDAHPDQRFWAMPRRIWLLHENATLSEPCDICGEAETKLYRQYLTKNYGVNYHGPWLHPLSPYNIDKDNQPIPVHPQPGGIGYRHWLGLVENSSDNSRRIARVVEQYRKLQRKDDDDRRLWAFGYDMENMKARCWYDAEMPIILVSEDVEAEYKEQIEAMIQAAQQVASEVRRHVKNALFGPKAEIRGDLSYIDGRFWSATEPIFYALLRRTRDVLNTGEDASLLLHEWYTTLTSTARRIFDDASQTGDFNAADPRRIACAWNALNKALARKKLRELLKLAA